MVNLLLIAIMLVKAVGFSSVMASIEEDSIHCDPVSMDDRQGVFEHASASNSGYSNIQQGDEIPVDNSTDASCCATPACSAAVVACVTLIQGTAHSNHYISIKFSMEGIILPADIKPPRNVPA